MIDANCPVCGAEIDVYLQCEPEDTETITLVDNNHSDEWECLQGCNKVTHSYWIATCENCQSEIDVLDEYIQPCNANSYPVEIKIFAPGKLQANVLKEWMTVATENAAQQANGADAESKALSTEEKHSN